MFSWRQSLAVAYNYRHNLQNPRVSAAIVHCDIDFFLARTAASLSSSWLNVWNDLTFRRICNMTESSEAEYHDRCNSIHNPGRYIGIRTPQLPTFKRIHLNKTNKTYKCFWIFLNTSRTTIRFGLYSPCSITSHRSLTNRYLYITLANVFLRAMCFLT